MLANRQIFQYYHLIAKTKSLLLTNLNSTQKGTKSMSKTIEILPVSDTGKPNNMLEHINNATIIHSPCSYKKYLPEATPETHKQFLQASGVIAYKPTNNYMFQGLFQEDTESLTNLICATLHWPRSIVKSIEITNPIVLGQYIENKTFILDIKVLLNDDTIVNLEMQLNNYKNWPERSLSYLCRNFDNLNKGSDYTNVKTAIHIGFLDFTLFPQHPEFHSIYKMQNIKNHNIYTDKFMLHVIELNSINLATEEDHNYEIDKWASLFKSKTWEDIRMLTNDNPTLQTAAETLYRLNMDERFRETCERFAQAEIEHNSAIQRNITLTQINESLSGEIADKNAQIADKDAQIAELKARLALLEKATDK